MLLPKMNKLAITAENDLSVKTERPFFCSVVFQLYSPVTALKAMKFSTAFTEMV